LLGAALDKLVDAEVLAADNRVSAEYFAWAAVHGLAVLAIDGPLRNLNLKQFDELGQRLLDMVEKGL